MPSIKQLWLTGLSLVSYVSAHFTVSTPTPLGNNINNEDVSPCGGFSPSANQNTTDFHVGGDAIGLVTLHAQAGFAYRGQLGFSLTSPNWTVLIPTIEEFGLNSFCEPSVPVPASWAGQTGLLQIIQDAEDGVHYQCMAVNFVAGTGTPDSSTCSNSSGVSATYQSDSTLSQIESGGSPSSSGSTPASTASQTTSPATSSASAAASPSTSKSAAFQSAKMEAASISLLFAGVFAFLLAA